VHEALLDQEIQRPVDRDRCQPPAAGRRNPVGEIIGPDRAMVAMQRLQRLAPDRRQPQAALAADPLGPGQRLGGVFAMFMSVPAGRVVFRAVLLVLVVERMAVIARRLHFGHVALQWETRHSFARPFRIDDISFILHAT
jgi:hypothetical protein